MAQAAQTSLAQLRRPDAPSAPAEMRAGFDTVGGFELMQRAAKVFAASDIVPPNYKGNIANCVIAVDMAMRMGANPLMVMQNLYLVYNRPAWSAKFLIATINKCGRFSALRYEFQGKEGTDEWGCRAVATELATGEKLTGPLITIGLAKKEGWYDKVGKSGNAASKWPTMPELMLRYRAASWFVSAYAPELAMGLQTVEEVRDTYDMEVAPGGGYQVVTEDIRRNEAEETEPEPAPEEPKAEKTAPPKRRAPAKPQANQEHQPAQQPEPKPEAKPESRAEQQVPFPQGEQEGEFGNDPFPASAMTVPCPNKNGQPVDELNCVTCPSREGCPSWE